MTSKSKIVSYDREFLFAISQLFNTPKVLKLEDKKHKEYISKVLFKTCTGRKKKFTVTYTYDWFYQILFEQYRCEYIYKNEIAKQLLLEKHPTADARLFTEVSVHKSKADVLIVNGTSSVYEIKTELDSFDRLGSQLESYSLVFDLVNVVTHPSMVKALKMHLEKSVGIMVLDENGKIKTLRKAISNKKNISQQYIFNLLNKAEYLNIIKNHFGYIPDATPVTLFNECKKLFCQIPPDKAHDYMVSELRNRTTPAYRTELLQNLPASLKLIASAGSLTRKNCELINNSLKVYL